MKTIKKCCAIIVLLLFSTTAFCQVRLPKLISNGMVLQREACIKIWGWAAPNEGIEVNFLSIKKTVKSNSVGTWELSLSKLPAGGPYTMTLRASNIITINDILIGYVWLCFGPWNMMGLWMSNVASIYPKDVSNSNNACIRNFNVLRDCEFTSPRTDLSDRYWMKPNPTNVLKFSAAAYFFSKELNIRNPAVPIGLLRTSKCGTPIHAWMTEKALKNFPETPLI